MREAKTFDVLLLVILGLIGSFVQYFMATSYKYAEATILVTLRYIAIPLAGIFGYFIFFSHAGEAEYCFTANLFGSHFACFSVIPHLS